MEIDLKGFEGDEKKIKELKALYRKIGETMKTIKPDQLPMDCDEYKLNTDIKDFIKKIDLWNQLKHEYDAHRKHVQKLKKEEMNTNRKHTFQKCVQLGKLQSKARRRLYRRCRDPGTPKKAKKC